MCTTGSLADALSPDWAAALAPVTPELAELADFLAKQQAYLPPPDRVMRAFEQPLGQVKVLVVGQDPYPTPGHAVGLSFAVDPEVRPIPRSLANIFTEYEADLGLPRPSNGDLSVWERRGVLLLNRVLTVAPGAAGSHRRRGWEAVTECAIRALAARDRPLVAILWGKDAAAAKPWLGRYPTIESAHPSPLSARRGFFGSHPFTRANAALVAQGADPVDWELPTAGFQSPLF